MSCYAIAADAEWVQNESLSDFWRPKDIKDTVDPALSTVSYTLKKEKNYAF